ncbi:MAG: DUF5665 domain-containing protein [Bacillota bacterium]|nr:DUF5665 domain-containing protein [Bacillota bacterium]
MEGQPPEKNPLDKVNEKLEEISLNMEKMGISEYVEMLHNPWRLFFVNFWAGVARGFGMAIGFTVLAAVVIYLLQKIVVLNMPLIGDFIADIVNIVVNQLGAGGAVFHGSGGGGKM